MLLKNPFIPHCRGKKKKKKSHYVLSDINKYANWEAKQCKPELFDFKKTETISWDAISSMDTNSVTPEINLTDLLPAEAKQKKQLELYYRKFCLMEEVNLCFMAVYIYLLYI